MIFVSVRVADLSKPYVPSVKMECDTCKSLIWVDKRAVVHAKACNSRMCVDCMLKQEELNG